MLRFATIIAFVWMSLLFGTPIALAEDQKCACASDATVVEAEPEYAVIAVDLAEPESREPANCSAPYVFQREADEVRKYTAGEKVHVCDGEIQKKSE